MRWLCWIGCVCLLMAEAKAQQPQFAFRISFTDKKGSAAPALSARSLQRRAGQGIPLDSTDRPVTGAYVDSVVTLTAGALHNTSRWMNQCVVLLHDSSKVLQLAGKPFIRSIEYVGYFATGLHLKQVDPGAAATGDRKGHTAGMKQTGSATFYGNAFNQTTMVNGDYLHDRGYMGAGKLIAVLDAGFTEANVHQGFDSLRQRGGIVDVYNFRVNDTNVFQYDIHGTEALSTMAGYLPGLFVGTAPKASYALYVTDDYQFSDALYELDNFVAGMERADSIGADIISSSVGYNEFTSPYYYLFPKTQLDGHTTLVARGVNLAAAKGILVVTSAGNEGGNFWNFLLTPADADSVLAVGAVTPGRSPAYFSGPGPNAAGRIKPDVCTQGNPAAVFSYNHSVIYGNGTSWATPQIAGWAACLWQSNTHASPFAVRQAIITSADQFANPGAQTGYGIPDFKKAFKTLEVLRVPSLIISPNPFNDYVLVQLAFRVPVTARFVLTDAAGKRLMTLEATVEDGNQDLRVAMPPGLPTGIYFLQTTVGGQTYLNKLVKG